MRQNLPCCTVDETLNILIEFDAGKGEQAANMMKEILDTKPYFTEDNCWTWRECYGAIRDLHMKFNTIQK